MRPQAQLASSTHPGNSMRRFHPFALALVLAVLPGAVKAQAPARDALVIATGEDVQLPIPTLTGSAEASRVADLLFLHLGRFAGTTVGDKAAVPELAERWTRADDPHARLRPRPARPVARRHPRHDARRALQLRAGAEPEARTLPPRLLREVESVTAEGERRFSHPLRARVSGAAVRRDVPRAHPAGAPACRRPARQSRHLRVRAAAGGQWAVPLRAARSRAVHRARGGARLLPRAAHGAADHLPLRHRARGPDEPACSRARPTCWKTSSRR